MKRKVHTAPTSNNPTSPAFAVQTPDLIQPKNVCEPNKKTKFTGRAHSQVLKLSSTPNHTKPPIDKGKKPIQVSSLDFDDYVELESDSSDVYSDKGILMVYFGRFVITCSIIYLHLWDNFLQILVTTSFMKQRNSFPMLKAVC